jgi:hypothetical protein
MRILGSSLAKMVQMTLDALEQSASVDAKRRHFPPGTSDAQPFADQGIRPAFAIRARSTALAPFDIRDPMTNATLVFLRDNDDQLGDLQTLQFAQPDQTSA